MAQSELALKLQTTQQTVSRWLKGINEPDLDTLLKICLYLNETPNSLLGYDEIPKEIFEEYKNNSPPEALRPRGDYLYDKGENDELFHVNLLKNNFI